jgi:hypothetical protein
MNSKDKNEEDDLPEQGGRFTKRKLSQPKGDHPNLRNSLFDEFVPIRDRLERMGQYHSEKLKAQGLPFSPELFVSEAGDVVPDEEIYTTECDIRFLDLYFISHRGFDRDSIQALSARIVTSCHLALRGEGDRALEHAFYAGEAAILYEVYKKYDYGQLKKGGKRKPRKNLALISLLKSFLIESPKISASRIAEKFALSPNAREVDDEFIQYWREENPLKLVVSKDGEPDFKFGYRTFTDYVRELRKELKNP